jgi:hypothetical protein
MANQKPGDAGSGSSRRVQGGCPPGTSVGGSHGSPSKQWATVGSITGPTGWQKFETCPDWGAKLFLYTDLRARWLTATGGGAPLQTPDSE